MFYRMAQLQLTIHIQYHNYCNNICFDRNLRHNLEYITHIFRTKSSFNSYQHKSNVGCILDFSYQHIINKIAHNFPLHKYLFSYYKNNHLNMLHKYHLDTSDNYSNQGYNICYHKVEHYFHIHNNSLD